MFNDEEVGTEAHDRIVNWLSLPENFAHAAEIVFGIKSGPWLDQPPQVEYAVTSGHNKFLLGFADLVTPEILIEVKTGTIRTGELLRQVNAYRSAHRFRYTWLVTPQELDSTTITVLQNQGVSYVHFTWGDASQEHPTLQADQARKHYLKNHLGDVRRAIIRYLDSSASKRHSEVTEQEEQHVNVSLERSTYLVALPLSADDARFGSDLERIRLLTWLQSRLIVPRGLELELHCVGAPTSLSEQFEALRTDFWADESEGG